MTTPCVHPIEVCRLRKIFNGKAAVDNLTLTVERGEVFGFLGPNGAGKTTSVKMLLGLIVPTSGSGTLFGLPLGDPQGRTKVGFLPEHFRFHDWLKASEFLRLHGDLYGMDDDLTRRRVPELLELVGLAANADQRLRTFSKGMLQRIGLAQALLNEPDLVVLDEPTSGLDPVGRRLVRDIIHDLSERGTTVFLNSHLLSEVEVTCHRVAFINQGKVIRTSSLRTESGGPLAEAELSVEIRARPRAGWDAMRGGQWEATMEGLRKWAGELRVDGERVTLTLASEADVPEIARYLVANAIDVYELSPQRLSLEDLFMRLVRTEEEP